MAKATRRAEISEEQPSVRVDWTHEPTAVHVDHGEVYSSADTFALVLCSISPASAGKTPLTARIVASARMNPAKFWNLLATMANNWNSYADQYLPPEIPRLSIVSGAKRSAGTTDERASPEPQSPGG